jgi:hypothetical protein
MNGGLYKDMRLAQKRSRKAHCLRTPVIGGPCASRQSPITVVLRTFANEVGESWPDLNSQDMVAPGAGAACVVGAE